MRTKYGGAVQANLENRRRFESDRSSNMQRENMEFNQSMQVASQAASQARESRTEQRYQDNQDRQFEADQQSNQRFEDAQAKSDARYETAQGRLDTREQLTSDALEYKKTSDRSDQEYERGQDKINQEFKESSLESMETRQDKQLQATKDASDLRSKEARATAEFKTQSADNAVKNSNISNFHKTSTGDPGGMERAVIENGGTDFNTTQNGGFTYMMDGKPVHLTPTPAVVANRKKTLETRVSNQAQWKSDKFKMENGGEMPSVISSMDKYYSESGDKFRQLDSVISQFPSTDPQDVQTAYSTAHNSVLSDMAKDAGIDMPEIDNFEDFSEFLGEALPIARAEGKSKKEHGSALRAIFDKKVNIRTMEDLESSGVSPELRSVTTPIKSWGHFPPSESAIRGDNTIAEIIPSARNIGSVEQSSQTMSNLEELVESGSLGEGTKGIDMLEAAQFKQLGIKEMLNDPTVSDIHKKSLTDQYELLGTVINYSLIASEARSKGENAKFPTTNDISALTRDGVSAEGLAESELGGKDSPEVMVDMAMAVTPKHAQMYEMNKLIGTMLDDNESFRITDEVTPKGIVHKRLEDQYLRMREQKVSEGSFSATDRVSELTRATENYADFNSGYMEKMLNMPMTDPAAEMESRDKAFKKLVQDLKGINDDTSSGQTVLHRAKGKLTQLRALAQSDKNNELGIKDIDIGAIYDRVIEAPYQREYESGVKLSREDRDFYEIDSGHESFTMGSKAWKAKEASPQRMGRRKLSPSK